MRAGELCNREVVIAKSTESVLDAACLMRHHHVGDVVVVEARDGQNVPIAVLTDRDLVVEVLAGAPERCAELTIGDVITTEDLAVIGERAQVSEILSLMRRRGVRRVPVVSDTKALVGIVTYDDLVEFLATQLGDLASVVNRQLGNERDARP